MDAQIKSSEYIDGLPYWDFFVDEDQGIVPMITGDNAEAQQAAIAVYLFKDSTPQLAGSDQYVDWLGFFTGETTFGELDAQIRKSLNNAGRDEYSPSYGIVDDHMKMKLTKA